MGIDLKMLIVVPEPHHLDRREVLRRSARLSRNVGHSNFHIVAKGEGWMRKAFDTARADNPGLDAEAAMQCVEDTLAGEHHAMSIVPPWSKLLSHADYGEEEEHYPEHYGYPVFTQDGPPKVGRAGEQFIEVHWSMRYWGPGYERGNWPTIREAIIHIMSTFPEGTEVWMGGDSSGVCLDLMDDALMSTFEAHWQEWGNEPYVQSWGTFSGSTPVECPVCLEPMAVRGFMGKDNGRYDLLACSSCGREGLRHGERHVIGHLPFRNGRDAGEVLFHAMKRDLTGLVPRDMLDKIEEEMAALPLAARSAAEGGGSQT